MGKDNPEKCLTELPFRATFYSIDSDTEWVVTILRIGEIIACNTLITVFDRFDFHCVDGGKGYLVNGESPYPNRVVADGQVCKSIVETCRVPFTQSDQYENLTKQDIGGSLPPRMPVWSEIYIIADVVETLAAISLCWGRMLAWPVTVIATNPKTQ